MTAKTSKGEQKLINLFNRGGIQFIREVSFEDLHGKSKHLLRFDFALIKNGKLYALVEFDGRQHYEFTPYFHKCRADFLRQQEWDRRKNQYCLMKKIPFIRIPYWDLNNLTLQKILTNPEYRVTNKYHIDILKQSKGV